jgi:hypothetical protein
MTCMRNMPFDFAMAFQAAFEDAVAAARFAGTAVERWTRVTLEANESALRGIVDAVISQDISQETAEQLFRLNEAMIRDEAELGQVTVTAQAAVSAFFAALLVELKNKLKLVA